MLADQVVGDAGAGRRGGACQLGGSQRLYGRVRPLAHSYGIEAQKLGDLVITPTLDEQQREDRAIFVAQRIQRNGVGSAHRDGSPMFT